VYASKIEVRITPYKKQLDQFSMVKNNYNRNLVATFNNETGVLEIVHNGAPVTEEDWQTVLNYPTYRLYIRVSTILLYDTVKPAATNVLIFMCCYSCLYVYVCRTPYLERVICILMGSMSGPSPCK
jgi:hypothetical protein